jgi:hypothetical protein
MRKLSKERIAERDALQGKFYDLETALEIAADEFNSAVEAAWEKVEAAMTAYNEAIADANQWQQDCAAAIQDYIDGRSEKWQASEKGQEYAEWVREYEETFDELNLEKPNELSLDLENMSELLGERNEGLGEA